MTTPAVWSSPQIPPQLGDKEVHVWRACLQPEPALLGRFEGLLSSAEKERSSKFLVSHVRADFVSTRGILRELLSAYVGEAAREIAIEYGPFGKPFLRNTGSAGALQFNISHSHGHAVFAFARRSMVGIDVEKIRAEIAGEEIAGRFFSEREIGELSTVSREERAQAFFKCWTRKEAYIKARGEGLQIPLRSFDVSILTDEPQQLRDKDGAVWSAYSFEPAEGFLGAVAVRGEEWSVQYFDWQPEAAAG